jgi:hypothetical protein
MRTIPSAGYSLLIIPMNLVYKKLAIFMTDFGKKTKKDTRGISIMRGRGGGGQSPLQSSKILVGHFWKNF